MGIFTNTPVAIHGPIFLQEIRGEKHFYFVGEDHSREGACLQKQPSIHVVNAIVEYANHHPSEHITIVVEHSSITDAIVRSQPMPGRVLTPIQTLVDRLLALPKNIEVHLTDVRDDPLYLPLQSLYMFPVYCAKASFLTFHSSSQDYARFVQTVHRQAKQFEKDILEHLGTRRKARNLMEALVLPSKPLPSWYTAHQQRMLPHRKEETCTPLKRLLAELQQKDAVYYDHVVSYLEKRLLLWLDSNPQHTQVMNYVLHRRKTISPNLEASKDAELTHFLTTLYSCLQDLAMMAHARLRPTDHFMMFTGAAHAFHMSPFFVELGTSSVYGIDGSGCINLAQHGVLNEPVQISDAPIEHYFRSMIQRYEIA